MTADARLFHTVQLLRWAEALVARIRDATGTPCRVDFSIEDDIPPTESGKHLYSMSKIERT